MSAARADLLELARTLLPVGTFMLGFVTSRVSMTRKEKADVMQKRFENSRDLMERQEETFQRYSAAIAAYVDCDADGEVDHFLAIATTGETYFYQLRIASDAILSGHVTPSARDNTLVPKIREAALKSLPAHYGIMAEIAARKRFAYGGVLERDNYAALYAVVEKHGGLRL